MSSPLIFKHRQRNPRGFVKSISGKGSLPTNQWAYKYVLYMGRREGVIKHDELIPNCNLFQTNKIINTLTQKINNRLNSCV